MSDWKIVVPETGTNLCKNPVAGTTLNFADIAGGVTTRNTAAGYALFGGWTYLVTTTSDNDGVSFTLHALANAVHYVTVRVNGKAAGGWDWSLDNSNWNEPTLLFEERNGTTDVYGYSFLAAQANASTTLYIQQKGATGDDYRIQHIQVEQAAYYTDPITGDLDGCYWYGAPHASKSTRKSSCRSSGREYDLETDFYLKVRNPVGIGPAPLAHRIQPQALLPGSTYGGSTPQMREIILKSVITGATLEGLHARMEDLWDVFKPDRVKGNQPFVLRYLGADDANPVEISCYADPIPEELEFLAYHYTHIRLLCPAPFFYEKFSTNAHLTTVQSLANCDYLVKKTGNDWAIVSTNFNGAVYALAKRVGSAAKYILVGGAFTNLGGLGEADYFVAIDQDGTMSSLTGIDAALNGNVRAIAVSAKPGDTVYIGGEFTDAGGVAAADGIFIWDGGAATAMGTGVSAGHQVNALAIGQDGTLYAGGDFTAMNSVANTDGIAKWTGAAWAALGTGCSGGNNTVNALAVGLDGAIYAAGDFTQMGGVANTAYIAKWTGSAWAAMGTGMNGVVNTLLVAKNGVLYAKGEFTTAGGVAALYIAQWNGAAWSAVGPGLDNISGTALAEDDNGLLWIGQNSGSATAPGPVVWNGGAMVAADLNLPADYYAFAALCDGEDVWIGGNFTGTGTSGEKNSVTNLGTASAYPKLVLSRSGGTTAIFRYLKNETTGATIWANYSLLDGETLTIDLTPGSKTVTSSMFGNVYGRAIKRGSDFATWCLLPGSNDVTCYVAQAGSPTITCYLTWRRPHSSADGGAV